MQNRLCGCIILILAKAKKMRNLLLTAIVIIGLTVLKVSAQDTLLMNDRTEQYVTILEVDENCITYKKTGNPAGPAYKTDRSKVFMAIYKDGSRETFSTAAPPGGSAAGGDQKPALANHQFQVRLVSTVSNYEKRKKTISVTATVDAYTGGTLFSRLSISASQEPGKPEDFNNPRSAYYYENAVYVSCESKKLQDLLFQKYEHTSGVGFGWALAPNFFAANTTACEVALLYQKPGNKEILGFGGFSATKFELQDCSSIETRLLSIALLWLEKNFSK